MLEIRISGEPKEIADLIAELEDRQQKNVYTAGLDIPDCSADDLIVKDREHGHIEMIGA